jgi:hypothetical protein
LNFKNITLTPYFYVSQLEKIPDRTVFVFKLDVSYFYIAYDTVFSVGTAGIILQAPTLYDTRTAIDTQLSAISYATIKPPEV